MPKPEKRPRRSAGDDKERRSDEKPGTGRSSYKSGRSFTRNKQQRSSDRKRGAQEGKPRRPAGGPDKPGYGGSRSERPQKPGRSFQEREERPRRRYDDEAGTKRDAGPREERPRTSGYRSRSGDESERPRRRDNDEAGTRRDERSREQSAPRTGGYRSRPGNEGERSRGDRFNRGDRERPAQREPADGERSERRRPSRGEGPGENRDRPSRGFGHKGDRRESGRRDDRDRPRGFRRDEEKAERDAPPKKEKGEAPKRKQSGGDELVRLNKYLSNAGVASRREADKLIESGAVTVNGEVITQLGYKIKPGDEVNYGGQPIKGERKVYLLLNKPKDYITTVEDERGRKTVMDLIRGACRERVYPVGRLDRNTTGVLLFTNDGELTTKLTHPKFGIKKVYNVTLSRGLKPDDFRKIVEGVELEDGIIKADDVAFTGEGKKEIGIEIHSGRNRVVRRLFEHLGYEVIKLDRVVFAGLTKKDLSRGKHRFLSPKEVAYLKMLG